MPRARTACASASSVSAPRISEYALWTWRWANATAASAAGVEREPEREPRRGLQCVRAEPHAHAVERGLERRGPRRERGVHRAAGGGVPVPERELPGARRDPPRLQPQPPHAHAAGRRALQQRERRRAQLRGPAERLRERPLCRVAAAVGVEDVEREPARALPARAEPRA